MIFKHHYQYLFSQVNFALNACKQIYLEFLIHYDAVLIACDNKEQ